MNFEKPSAERMGAGREKLLEMEKEGKFVFHGSSDFIAKLEPRQAYNQSLETGNMEVDGEPAVFATPYADAAIFRALVNKKGVIGNSTSKFDIKDGQLIFSATENLLEHAKNKTGRVYVMDKAKFSEFKGVECKSFETVEPLDVIDVAFDDLPPVIEKIDL